MMRVQKILHWDDETSLQVYQPTGKMKSLDCQKIVFWLYSECLQNIKFGRYQEEQFLAKFVTKKLQIRPNISL